MAYKSQDISLLRHLHEVPDIVRVLEPEEVLEAGGVGVVQSPRI